MTINEFLNLTPTEIIKIVRGLENVSQDFAGLFTGVYRKERRVVKKNKNNPLKVNKIIVSSRFCGGISIRFCNVDHSKSFIDPQTDTVFTLYFTVVAGIIYLTSLDVYIEMTGEYKYLQLSDQSNKKLIDILKGIKHEELESLWM